MSETNALGSESDGIPITWKGRIYKMMPIDLKGEGAFVEWMKARGRAEIYAMKDSVEPDDYAAALAVFAANAPNKFAFWGKEGIKARRTVDGVVKVIHISIQASLSKFSEANARKLFEEEGDQVLEALKSFFPPEKNPEPEDEEEAEMSEETPTPLDLEILPTAKLDLLRGRTGTTSAPTKTGDSAS